MTGQHFLPIILVCLGFALSGSFAWSQDAPPAPPPPPAPQINQPPPPAAAPQELSHDEMVREQERRDRESEAERDRDDL